MWGVHPKLLCDLHLLAEHKDMHFFAWALHDKRSLQSFIKEGLVTPQDILPRHHKLVKEMNARDMICMNEFPRFRSYVAKELDIWNNLFHLARECRACRGRMEKSLIWFINGGYSAIHKHQYLLNFIRELDNERER